MPPAGSKNAPEAQAREKIDALLEEAGWAIQDRDEMNLSVPAVAVRESKLAPGNGVRCPAVAALTARMRLR